MAALDAESERLIVEAVERYTARGHSALIIAHRLTTITAVDEILVMKNGTVVEQGKYEDLLLRGGEFARIASGVK